MSYVLATTLGASILAWPLFQGEIPANWGDWPLTVVVMAFAIVVLRIVFAGFKDKDDRFAERMVAKDDAFAKMMNETLAQHAAAVENFSKTLVEVQTVGHAHGDLMRKDNAAMRKSVDHLANAISRTAKPKKK